MEKAYRIFSKLETPFKSHSDFIFPKTIYTLIQDDGQRVRVSLPRRSDWEVGCVVKIEEILVRANIIE